MSGNVFFTGDFSRSTITFGTYTLTKAGPGSAVFIAKYDANGNVLWAKSAGGTSGDGGYSVSADTSGNAFIAGYFSSPTIVFGTFTLTNAGSSSLFLTKYDINGNVLWAKSAGGSGIDFATGVSASANGSVFITGVLSSPTLAFGTTTLTNSSGNDAIFIAKYDPSGNVLWAKSAGGISNDDSYAVSTDINNNVFITGGFSSPNITFGAYTLTNSGINSALFLVKYDTNGNVLWAKGAGGINGDAGNSVSTDVTGNVFITGYFASPNITLGTYTLTNAGVSNVFIAKYDINGNTLWAKSASGSGSDEGYSVSTYTGGVFVTGGFNSSTIAFGTNTLIPPTGATDPTFIVLYDLNGNLICDKALSSGADDQNGVSADKYGNAYITGDFFANPFILGSNTLTPTGAEDIFIAKFNCQPDITVIETLNQNLVPKIFPNPNNGSFKVQIESEIQNGEIILINSIGQKAYEQKISKGETQIITNSLSKGLYNYVLLQNKQKISGGKLAIE